MGKIWEKVPSWNFTHGFFRAIYRNTYPFFDGKTHGFVQISRWFIMKNGKVLNNPVQVWKPELHPALGILSIHTSPFRCTSHQFATEFPFSVIMNLIFPFDGHTVDGSTTAPPCIVETCWNPVYKSWDKPPINLCRSSSTRNPIPNPWFSMVLQPITSVLQGDDTVFHDYSMFIHFHEISI